MAVATTFGTASTGTAISALSGAAATNAALAWLGGGAVAAGGGGMAAGNTLLALAGPVGWAIGGVAIAGSGIYLNKRNKDLAKKATQQRIEVEAELRSFQTVRREIEGFRERTSKHVEGCLAELDWLISYDPKRYRRFNWLRSMIESLFRLTYHDPNNYQRFSQEQKERLAALINHIRSLSELLNRRSAL